MEIREGQGGRCFGLGNPGGRGGYSDPGNPAGWGGGGSKKPCHPSGRGVWIFSGITQCHIPR